LGLDRATYNLILTTRITSCDDNFLAYSINQLNRENSMLID
jgi:hypothetical protein